MATDFVDIQNSPTTASLGGVSFRLDPQRVSWRYSVKTKVINTVGGKVVQVFGVAIGDITLFGSFGQGGFLAQLDFFNKIRAVMDKQAAQEIPKPVRFIFPARGWDMNVYIQAISDPESDTSMAVRPNRVNPQWSITLFASDGGTKLKKVAIDDYLKRLAGGIGWEVSDFNGPGDEDTSVAQIGESGLVTSSTGSPTSTDTAVTTSTGGDNQERIWNALRGKGLTVNQTAGIMGNMYAESRFQPGVEETTQRAEKGYGLCQWTFGRRTNLEKFAQDHGKSASDLDLQIAFLWSELNGPYKDKVLTPLQASTTVEEATRIFLTHFEVPANAASHLPTRTGYAKSVLANSWAK